MEVQERPKKEKTLKSEPRFLGHLVTLVLEILTVFWH